MSQNVSQWANKCLKGWRACIYRCESCHYLALLLPVSIVAWAYIRSVSIEPRSCLLLRSEPSIVSFKWQGSLVIRLVAIVSINGLSWKKCIALIGKFRSCLQFLLLHYCLLVIPQSDMNFWDFWGFFEIWRIADLNLRIYTANCEQWIKKLNTSVGSCCSDLGPESQVTHHAPWLRLSTRAVQRV